MTSAISSTRASRFSAPQQRLDRTRIGDVARHDRAIDSLGAQFGGGAVEAVGVAVGEHEAVLVAEETSRAQPDATGRAGDESDGIRTGHRLDYALAQRFSRPSCDGGRGGPGRVGDSCSSVMR